MALFDGNLLPASFRGVPFAVLSDELGGGRRVALHQYPGKDEPWAEDMGREARRWRFRGFIVDGDVALAGGPIQLQRALLIAALEASGSGTLTHPTLGVRNVSVQRFSVGQELDASRRSSIDIEFVESGKRAFPKLSAATSKLLSAANLCKIALVADGVRAVALAAGAGGTRQDLTRSATAWSARATELGNDATALHRLAAQLPGNYGRFSAGGNAGFVGTAKTIFAPGTAVDELVAIASGARVGIRAVVQRLALATSTSPLDFAVEMGDAIVALVQALADACADPADAIRLLEQLLDLHPSGPEAETPIGRAIGGMMRRACASSLVIAVGAYQPRSADDAAAMLARIAERLDLVATYAEDRRDDQSFNALRAARADVVQDLRARGATLARVKTFRSARATPAIVLAQRLYRDPSRADQLVMQAGAISHPLFMPVELQALAA